MKRSFHDDHNVFAACQNREPGIQERSQIDHGKDLRKFLWLAYLSNKQVDATFVSQLAWGTTSAGGRGVEDLGVRPESTHGHDHVRLLLGQNF